MEVKTSDLGDVLNGLKVIELASVLAGPSVGMFLAELGADVVKIENPFTGGDVTRSWKLNTEEVSESRSAYFCSVNWGKESLSLDLTSKESRARLREMISSCDILLTSFKKGDDIKFGLEPNEIIARHPKLIYASIIGYSGEDERVAYDAAIQAESGWWHINGERGGEGHKLPVAVVDVFAGHQLKQGILAAIIKRSQTGLGSHVVVSLFDSAVSALVNQASNWLVGGADPEAMGSEHPNISPYGNSFICKDGKKIMLAVGSNRQYISMCNTLQIDPDPKLFGTNKLRVLNRAKLKEILIPAFKKFDASSLFIKFRKLNVPCAEVAPISHAMKSVREELFLRADNKTGLRQAVFCSSRQLCSPPVFKKDEN